MPAEVRIPGNQEAIIRRHPVVAYFALTFLISWTGALAVALVRSILSETRATWEIGTSERHAKELLLLKRAGSPTLRPRPYLR